MALVRMLELWVQMARCTPKKTDFSTSMGAISVYTHTNEDPGMIMGKIVHETKA